jgi:hypothetical protein
MRSRFAIIGRSVAGKAIPSTPRCGRGPLGLTEKPILLPPGRRVASPPMRYDRKRATGLRTRSWRHQGSPPAYGGRLVGTASRNPRWTGALARGCSIVRQQVAGYVSLHALSLGWIGFSCGGPPLPSPNDASVWIIWDCHPPANPEAWKFGWSDVWSDGDPEPGEHQLSIRLSNCSKPLTPLSPSRSDTTNSTAFSSH